MFLNNFIKKIALLLVYINYILSFNHTKNYHLMFENHCRNFDCYYDKSNVSDRLYRFNVYKNNMKERDAHSGAKHIK